MNRELFDRASSTPKLNNTKRYDNWYDRQYKPYRKKQIVLENTDPILQKSNSCKQLKFFGDPENFRSSVKRTQLSMRNSNIFSNQQTEISWKPSVKKIISAPASQQVQRKHVILTNYNQKYKRNPLTQAQEPKRAKIDLSKKKQRNPITQGQKKQLFQRKGRNYRFDF